LNYNARNRECKLRNLCYAFEVPLLLEYDAEIRGYRLTTFQPLEYESSLSFQNDAKQLSTDVASHATSVVARGSVGTLL